MKNVFISIILFLSTSLFCQIKNVDIIGRWDYHKLTWTKAGKTVDMPSDPWKSQIVFSNDGTYKETSETSGKKMIEKGKWKLIGNGTKVNLYDIITDDANSKVSDHDWKLSRAKDGLFMSYSYSDCINAPCSTIYKKAN